MFEEYAVPMAIGLGLIILGWLINRKLQLILDNKPNEQTAKDMANQMVGELSVKIIEQAREALTADKEAIYQNNKSNHETIQKLVDQLKEELNKRQNELRSLEQDRSQKFGDLSRAITEHRKITEELKMSTQSLTKILSNNQVRGQWGERIIEDILRSAGLLEKVHYLKQAMLKGSQVKPDIILLLPNERKVCIDVKFPYAEIQHLSLAETKTQKEHHLKAFEKDLREKINQVEKRGYINLEAGTLDYAIMFVPNEMLFSFINQQFPQIIDEAMAKKVMVVSPFTFLIVARTIMESYKNFMIENNLRMIVKRIGEFVTEWDRFTQEFDKFDGDLTKLRQSFDKIQQTRYKQMNLRIRQIRDSHEGKEIAGGEKLLIEEATEI